MNSFQKHPPEPDRLEEPHSYLPIFLVIIPVIEILMFAIAGYNLGYAVGGWFGISKLLLISAGAGLVAYAIYRMAIEKSALLYIKGSVLALVFSIASVGIVGGSFFVTTTAGLTNVIVEESSLGQFVQQVGTYSDARVAAADRAAEIAPIMDAMTQDLSARTEAEGATGTGPIFRALNGLFRRTGGLSQQINDSLIARQIILTQIAETLRIMDEILAGEGRNIWTRRTELRRHYSQLQRLWVELDAAVPVSLVRSFSAELGGGVLIPNRADANARINHTLGGYAATLAEALEAQSDAVGDPIVFPEKTGALETFKHAGRNLPVVMAALLVDILFPYALLFYSVSTLRIADIDNNPQRWARKQRAKRDIDTITEMRAGSIPTPADSNNADDDQTGAETSTLPPRTPQRSSRKSRR